MSDPQTGQGIMEPGNRTDKDALDTIARLMSGAEWSGIDDLVAEVVRETGREVSDLELDMEDDQ